MQGNLNTTEHVDGMLAKATNEMYAMNILRTHGMSTESLFEVFKAKIVSRLLYASPAWWGLSNQHDRNRIDQFLRRAIKLNYYPANGRMFEELCAEADRNLLKNITQNPSHVLHRFLPKIKEHHHNLRKRGNEYTLPAKDNRLFISRTLFSNL